MELTTLRSRLPNAVSSNSSNSLTALSAAAEVLIQTSVSSITSSKISFGKVIKRTIGHKEGEADILKKKLRLSLPSTFMMPFSRRDLCVKAVAFNGQSLEVSAVDDKG
jgi:uncharacterized protein Yka (UPF0111/DUF47 family)